MIALIIILVVVALFVVVYFVQPSLYALLYTLISPLFIRNPPFVDVDVYFPEAKLLKNNWKTIREELEKVMQRKESVPKFHEVDSIQRFISAKDDVAWRTFIIKGYDHWLENNCEQVPKTTELLRQLPNVTLAMFSILDGGKHIPPHIGFFKGVFRYHLALMVPDDAPIWIEVGGQKYSWKEGEDVLFDDTYRHQVWNKSKNVRVVLFCDVFRENSIPKWLRPVNRWCFNVIKNSPRLQAAGKRAEVPKDIGAETGNPAQA